MIRKKNNSWVVECYSPEKGRAVHVKPKDYGVDTPRTRREALDLERLALRANDRKGPETVGSFADRWMDDFPTGPKGEARSEVTRKKYRGWIKKFADEYRDTPLRAITREDARAWGLQNRSLVMTVKTMFSDAMSDDLVESNPFDGMSFTSPGRKHIDPPSIEDVARLADAAGNEAGLVWFTFYSGMRIGEVCAAKWENLDGNRYHVREQWNQTLHSLAECKHGSSGVVFVPDAGLRLPPRRLDSPFIFHNSHGKPWSSWALSRRWVVVRERAGFPDLPFHMLRHALAAHLLNVLRVEPWKIAQQMRHRDGGKLVVDLYGHPSVDVALDDIAAAYTDARSVVRLVPTDSSTENVDDIPC